MDQLNRRQQQPRSNSIGGQEFGLGGHQRLKQSLYTQQNPYIDPNLQYGQRLAGRYYPEGQFHQNQPSDRSISPMSINGRISEFHVAQRGGSIKYPPDKQPRNHLHASLECLNVVYSDYSQNHRQQQQQQQQQQQLLVHNLRYPQQHYQPNGHYAAGYVLAAAPAETVINQSTDQDLAAAAMGNPPQQYNPATSTVVGMANQLTGYQSQGLFNRGNQAQVPQSPLHRRINMNNMSTHGHGQSPNLLGQLATNSNCKSNNINNNCSTPIRAGHSSLSLASSSTYLIEDKLQNEIKKLQSELKSEREKNEALNSQLNINSNLMAAFEQSLTTLNTRLRQLSAMNEKKDKEIEELHERLDKTNLTNPSVGNESVGDRSSGEYIYDEDSVHISQEKQSRAPSEIDKDSEQNLLRMVDDLKRQLIEKDRLLTDTRLEALSAAHQLEQLESRLNGEHSMLANEDDLDEGVMVVNHSPSDSDAITDSAHFSEMNGPISRSNNNCNNKQKGFHQHQDQRDTNDTNEDMILFTPTHTNHATDANVNISSLSNHSHARDHSKADDTLNLTQSHQYQQEQQQQQQQQLDDQSNHSSCDYHAEDKSSGDASSQHDTGDRKAEQYIVDEGEEEEDNDNATLNRMLNNMLVSS